MTDLPPLRYLTSADVIAAMPPLPTSGSRSPSGRCAGSRATRSCRRRSASTRGPSRLVRARDAGPPAGRRRRRRGRPASGMKWVARGSARTTRVGLPAINARSCSTTRSRACPSAILDGGPITAERTAADLGRRHPARGRRRSSSRAPRVAIIGAGVQGRSHLPVLGHVLPGASARGLRPATRTGPRRWRRTRATATASAAAAVAPTARDAVADADVVVTAASFVAPPERQVDDRRLARAPTTLVVPVDYATTAPPRSRATRRSSSSTTATSSSPTATPASSTATRTRRRRSARRSSDGRRVRPPGACVVTHLGVGPRGRHLRRRDPAPRRGGRPRRRPAPMTGAPLQRGAGRRPDVVVVGAGTMGAWTAL